MFNRDGLFGKKDETPPRNDVRPVNVTPGLGSPSPIRAQPVETPRPDLRFAEPRMHAPSPASVPAPARAEESVGSKLIVGPDIKLRGVEITDCDTLVVEGRVEASMDSRVVQIAENGVFAGTVSIDVAEIRGRFEGELTARKQLVIYSTGRVSGRIHYGKIRIEEGGELSGEVSTLTATPSSSRQSLPAAAALAEPEKPAIEKIAAEKPSMEKAAASISHEPPAPSPAPPLRANRQSNKSSAGVNAV